MPADANARIKGLEAKGFGSSGGDDFLRIDPSRTACIADLIDIGNVDHTVAVLVQLCHLRGLGGGDRDDGVEGEGVDGD